MVETLVLKLSKKTLDDSQISFLKDNVNKLTMSQLKKELGVCDTIIRKEMLKHKIKFKSHNYGPIYKDIPKYLWVNLNRGAKERNLIVEISPKDIWEVYIKQNKLCALSSIKIFFGKTKQGNTTASVDRIDSRVGYTKANIQIVHKMINKMKTNLSQDDFIYFCKCVNNTFGDNI